jgi:hypothetical protein
MGQTTAAAVDIVLNCRPGKEGLCLVFPYRVQNRGETPVYVMDALATVDPESGRPKADTQAIVVVQAPGDEAIMGRLIAPPPADRRMAIPVIPLARHLPPGGMIENRIEVPIPLAEVSPYYADLLLRQYQVTQLKGVTFAIGYWVDGVDGLIASPVDFAPGLFNITTRQTGRSARVASQHFPTHQLQLLKRIDSFPREVAGLSVPAA